MRPVFGEAAQTLGHPATTRLLDRLWPTPATDPDRRIEQMNQAIVVDHVRTQLLTDRPTRYVIRRRDTGVFFHSIGPCGQRWVGGPDEAQRFEFVTIATATILFHLDEALESFDIVPVEG